MAVALFTTYLAGYRNPLYERLSASHDLHVLCYGGGERYVPAWFADLDAQLAAAPFPARRITGAAEAAREAGRYDAVIAPFAGGAILPAVYAGARARRRGFVLWASVWAEPRSPAHALARPAVRHIYRHADAVVAYGEHVRGFVRGIRGRDDDVFVAPQAVEPELFGRTVNPMETIAFHQRHGLPEDAPIVLYVGRLVPEKGVPILLEAWRRLTAAPAPPARTPGAPILVLIGDGPSAPPPGSVPGVHHVAPLAREELPVAYAAARCAVLASVPTPRFREPWGLVCNEAMHQGRPMIATDTVGAVAGGLVRHEHNGLVVAPGDPVALATAIERLLVDAALRARLGAQAREDVAPYTPDAMAEAFDRALARAIRPSPTGP